MIELIQMYFSMMSQKEYASDDRIDGDFFDYEQNEFVNYHIEYQESTKEYSIYGIN